MVFNLLYFAPDKVLGFAGVFICNSTLAGIIFSRTSSQHTQNSYLRAGRFCTCNWYCVVVRRSDSYHFSMLYSFNAILIAITLATFSSNQMLKPVFNIMFRIILTIFTQAAFTTLLKSFAIPVLTMPLY
ncbi:urea transporter [Snodgrassella alvi]